jgi:succinyl-CoA synthetase beta subunit
MRLYEYQGKQILKEKNIPIPKGGLASSNKEVFSIAQLLEGRVVIKAQVLVGGRGKAGGIVLANTAEGAEKISSQILGKEIKGLIVRKVLVEKAVEYKKEFYLALTVDRSKKRNILIFSSEGGMDIEELAFKKPEAIFRYPLSGFNNVNSLGDNLKKALGLGDNIFGELLDIVKKLYYIYFGLDCELLEINPLVLTNDNKLTALDAKVIIDDNALFRQERIASWKEEVETDDIEAEAHRRKIAYVKLKGNIGIIGNGAGLVMATMDMVKQVGGSPANFLDIGGGAKEDMMKNALEIILMDKQVKGVFINIFGGITRCDEVAKGLISAFSNRDINLPLVIRLHGTRCKEAKDLLTDERFTYVDSMEEGARTIVELVKKQRD